MFCDYLQWTTNLSISTANIRCSRNRNGWSRSSTFGIRKIRQVPSFIVGASFVTFISYSNGACWRWVNYKIIQSSNDGQTWWTAVKYFDKKKAGLIHWNYLRINISRTEIEASTQINVRFLPKCDQRIFRHVRCFRAIYLHINWIDCNPFEC